MIIKRKSKTKNIPGGKEKVEVEEKKAPGFEEKSKRHVTRQSGGNGNYSYSSSSSSSSEFISEN